jgi:NIPSNAP protein
MAGALVCAEDAGMKRRNFLAASFAASALGGAESAVKLIAEEPKMATEYYELRLIHLRRGPQVERMHGFLGEALIPGLNRAGVGPVGVFEVALGPDSPTLYLLAPFSSLDAWAETDEKLSKNPAYLQAGAAVINTPSSDPAFVRMESSLLEAFEGMPKLEAPAGAAGNRPRLFELRTYESHSNKAHAKKIEMFNKSEIAIFRRTGLQPVFFGDTLIGTRQPQLTYMLVFESEEARDRNWARFIADPDWKKLSTTPGYTDAETVSSITNVLLRPTAYSQI